MKIQTIGSLAIATAATLILNLGIAPVHAQQTEQPPAGEKQCEDHHGHHGHKKEAKQDDHHGDHHASNHHGH